MGTGSGMMRRGVGFGSTVESEWEYSAGDFEETKVGFI
jgi:hypothetical protein